MSEEPRQNQGRGLVDRKLVEAPSNFIAGRPKTALLFWFFGGFRCGVPLFIFILVIFYSDLPSFEQFLVPNSRVFDKIS